MAQLSIIQGGVRQRQMRALVLTRAAPAAPPVQVVLVDALGGVAQAVTVTRVPEAGSALRVQLDRSQVHAYQLEATTLQPATRYRLTAIAGAVQQSVAFSTLPGRLPPHGMTVAVASCYYDGYKRDQSLLKGLSDPWAGQTPAFHIWAGDNVYVDVPADSLSNHPYPQTAARYLRYLLDSGYARVRAQAPAFTMYDDHEFWNNYPEVVPWLSRTWGDSWLEYRKAALDCVKVFQSDLNPSEPQGHFRVDVAPLSFFFLDLRSLRNRRGDPAPAMASEAALQALEQWVDTWEGPGVLVTGQPLWIAEGGVFDYNPPSFRSQYARIWRALRRASYDTLVISGDVHHSRMLKISFRDTTNRHIYEFVSSPAVHIPQTIGSGQDRGKVDDVPGSAPHTGQNLSARYFFATDAPNSFGLLRFVPQGADEVRVGASFFEHEPINRYAAAKPIASLPRVEGTAFQHCNAVNLCTLKMR